MEAHLLHKPKSGLLLCLINTRYRMKPALAYAHIQFEAITITIRWEELQVPHF